MGKKVFTILPEIFCLSNNQCNLILIFLCGKNKAQHFICNIKIYLVYLCCKILGCVFWLFSYFL